MNTYLTFVLGDELFAVPVTQVLEVLQKQRITAVPKSPLHILGIINFRGDILPVINTRQKFNLLPANSDDNQVVIVFEILNLDKTKTNIAAIANTVNDVIQIHDHEIKTVPELGLNYDSRFIAGAVQRNNTFILLLDVEKLFSPQDASNYVQNSLNNFNS